MFLFRVVVIDNVEGNNPVLGVDETLGGAPLGSLEQRASGVLDVQGVNFQVLCVQKFQILLEINVDGGQTNACGEVARVVGAIHVGQAYRAVLQVWDFPQFIRGLEPPCGQLVPRNELVGLLAWR